MNPCVTASARWREGHNLTHCVISTQVLPAGVQEWFSAPDFKTCYPYFVLWTDLLLGRAWMPAMPSMPTLFIYGTRKRMMFHTDRFLSELRERTDGSRSVALDCGHLCGN